MISEGLTHRDESTEVVSERITLQITMKLLSSFTQQAITEYQPCAVTALGLIK